MSKFKLSKKRLHWPLLLALAASLLASGQEIKRQQPQPATAGVRIFIDPVTGAVREPEQDELQAAALAAANQAAVATAPQFLDHPSGAQGMLLGEDQMVYSVATIGPDGKLKMECINGKNNADTRVLTPSGKEMTDVR